MLIHHYDYTKTLESFWNKTVSFIQNGHLNWREYFDLGEIAMMASAGLKPFEIFDFAEDFVAQGEPDFVTFMLIHQVRRHYFFYKQKGIHSSSECDSRLLPSRDAQCEGIPWLPRIIAKATAKLRGELTPDIMYGCGGDRAFLKKYDMHPADFLFMVWECEENPDAIVTWIKTRSSSQSH